MKSCLRALSKSWRPPWGAVCSNRPAPVKKGLSIAWTDSSLSDLDACFPCIPRHKHGSRIQTHTHTHRQEVILTDVFLLHLAPHRWTAGRCVGFESVCVQEHRDIVMCEFFSVHFFTLSSLRGPSPHSYLSDWFSLSLSLKQSPSPFSRPGSILLSDQKPDSLMTTLYPIVQSAKITIPYLYLYWGKPFSASKQSGRECFPCWTCPVLPRLWYCCGLPSRRARLPVIGLPFSSHHLSALWIQLQGPKRTTTLQLKRLICPRPSLPPPSPPQLATSSLALICASVLLFLWIFLSLAFSSCLL